MSYFRSDNRGMMNRQNNSPMRLGGSGPNSSGGGGSGGRMDKPDQGRSNDRDRRNREDRGGPRTSR